jgi:guanine deaminase
MSYPTNIDDKIFLQQTVELAMENVRLGNGGPFAAIVVKQNRIIARGTNVVTSSNDPTAHAEIVAIRNACRTLNSFQLDDCTLYSSCEPCPMCLGAVYWSRVKRLVFAADKNQAAEAGFDDAFIYREIVLPYSQRSLITEQITGQSDNDPFDLWLNSENKITY